MQTYVDGTALSRYLDGAVEHADWLDWAADRAGSLVTSELALSELRRAAEPRGIDARQTARDVADRLSVVRFSDQCLAIAAMASSVLPPFAALHLGVAVAEPDVTAVATYDRVLAQVAVIYGIDVVSPGRAAQWWEGLA
jgi:predicted nucleic acid-binding protein